MDPEKVWIRDRVGHSQARLASRSQRLLLKNTLSSFYDELKILPFIQEGVNRQKKLNHEDCVSKGTSNTFKDHFSFHGGEKLLYI